MAHHGLRLFLGQVVAGPGNVREGEVVGVSLVPVQEPGMAGLIAVALLATIVGGSLDLEGFHRAAIVTEALMVAGGITSFLGIRNPPRSSDEPAAADADAAPLSD